MKRLITLFALLTMFAIGAQAQIVGANEGPKTSTNTTSSLCKPTGHYLRFEAGWFYDATVSYDYQINPYIMVGGGIGTVNALNLPLFAEAIFSTPRYKWSFYFNVKLGYDLIGSGLFTSLIAGANYKNFGLGIGINYEGWEEYFVPCVVVNYKLPLKTYR